MWYIPKLNHPNSRGSGAETKTQHSYVSLATDAFPFSVILEGPEGCQEALRKSVYSRDYSYVE